MKYLKVAFACSCLILVGCDPRSSMAYWQKDRCVTDDEDKMYQIQHETGRLYGIDPGCTVYKK